MKQHPSPPCHNKISRNGNKEEGSSLPSNKFSWQIIVKMTTISPQEVIQRTDRMPILHPFSKVDLSFQIKTRKDSKRTWRNGLELGVVRHLPQMTGTISESVLAARPSLMLAHHNAFPQSHHHWRCSLTSYCSRWTDRMLWSVRKLVTSQVVTAADTMGFNQPNQMASIPPISPRNTSKSQAYSHVAVKSFLRLWPSLCVSPNFPPGHQSSLKYVQVRKFISVTILTLSVYRNPIYMGEVLTTLELLTRDKH